MEGSVDLPAVGKVKKAYVLVPAGLAAAYIAYRWYAARQAAADAEPQGSDGLYTSGDLSEYGLSTTGGATSVTGNTGSIVTDATGDAIDTNSEWTNDALTKLGNQGYDTATVGAALGEFLARRALDKSEASIARTALAVSGQPPEGRPWSVIEEASTSTGTLGAPTGLKVTKTGPDYVNLAWSTVDGAAEYAVYRSDTGGMTVRAGPGSVTVYGLKPATSYSFQVAAVGSTGKVGAKSAPVSAKTAAATLTKPTTPTASAITRTSFRATTGAIKGASRYRWYLNGREVVGGEVPYKDFTGLKPNTPYSVGVRGDGPDAAVGPMSASRTVKTKK